MCEWLKQAVLKTIYGNVFNDLEMQQARVNAGKCDLMHSESAIECDGKTAW
jgi:hypothetical protein